MPGWMPLWQDDVAASNPLNTEKPVRSQANMRC